MGTATERLDLGGGQWWEIRTHLTRAMEKAITRASLAAIPAIATTDAPDAEALKSRLYSQIGLVDIGAVEDAYLLHGTVAYSFGPHVSLEIIDGIDAEAVRRVLTRMFELYSPQRVTEEQRDGFFGQRSSTS